MKQINKLRLKTIPQLYGNNFDSISSEKKIPIRDLLHKLNIVHHSSSGITHWLPIGTLILDKIKKIVFNRLTEIGFESLNLSALSKKRLWEISGRLSQQKNIFELKDEDHILVPTAEEDITNLVKNLHVHDKDYPLLYYQINNKYRNEKRPKNGILRGKEFLMKDGYSFHRTEECAVSTYEKVQLAYSKIFSDLRIQSLIADADSGNMGTGVSHEWHHLSSDGEDILFKCSNCESVSNIEKTKPYLREKTKDVEIKYYVSSYNTTLIKAHYPKNREINFFCLNSILKDLGLKTNFIEVSPSDKTTGYKVLNIIDNSLKKNEPENVLDANSKKTTLTETHFFDFIVAKDLDLCGKCKKGELSSFKSIEIGHTFYLEDRYTKNFKLKTRIISPNSSEPFTEKNILMNSYGIGISRLVFTICSAYRSINKLNWPFSVAPWQITVIESPSFDPSNREKLYNALQISDLDYRLDNRSHVDFSKKISNSALIGIPLVLIAGKKFPVLEIEVHNNFLSSSNLFSSFQNFHKINENFFFSKSVSSPFNDFYKILVHLSGLNTAIKSIMDLL